MDYYNKLPFRQLQREAKELGIYPVGGKGINRLVLLSKVEEYLNKRERDDEIYDRIREEYEREEKEKPKFLVFLKKLQI